MKLASLWLCLLIGCIWPFGLVANASEPVVTTLPTNDPVRIEWELIAKAHQSARGDDEAATDAQIAATGADRTVAPSVLLARRAMAVCGWLQNDNEYGCAMKVAQRALKQLATMKENNDKDREERLYWEALLEGRILDHKAIAVARLESAKKLAPDDDRVLDLYFEFSTALAQFGH